KGGRPGGPGAADYDPPPHDWQETTGAGRSFSGGTPGRFRSPRPPAARHPFSHEDREPFLSPLAEPDGERYGRELAPRQVPDHYQLALDDDRLHEVEALVCLTLSTKSRTISRHCQVSRVEKRGDAVRVVVEVHFASFVRVHGDQQPPPLVVCEGHVP